LAKVVPYLSASLAASNVASTRIMLPESTHWQSATYFYTTVMNDPAVAPFVHVALLRNLSTWKARTCDGNLLE
jgi:hypothetical protein